MTTDGTIPVGTEIRREVVVITGTGGMGRAIARRLGPSRALLLADVDAAALDSAAADLEAEGHAVATRQTDVSDPRAVAELATEADRLGPVRFLVHTAGLSPVQASPESILGVDLLGVAYVLDAFTEVVAPGGAGVVIASMAGHMAPPIAPEDESALARAPAGELASLPCLAEIRSGDSGLAYAFAKRANILRVRGVSSDWRRRGARINSISPGVIATPMGMAELAGPTGDLMKSWVGGSPGKRLGTTDDVAAAAEFLLGPQAAYVSGTDLLVDGGTVAAL
ncbi:MAG TPA: SDR family oxidoreductase [Acidimicrobiales bacterium]|nr:SDR family oxidoreductase [Acidimicrobiales bacterium]